MCMFTAPVEAVKGTIIALSFTTATPTPSMDSKLKEHIYVVSYATEINTGESSDVTEDIARPLSASTSASSTQQEDSTNCMILAVNNPNKHTPFFFNPGFDYVEALVDMVDPKPKPFVFGRARAGSARSFGDKPKIEHFTVGDWDVSHVPTVQQLVDESLRIDPKVASVIQDSYAAPRFSFVVARFRNRSGEAKRVLSYALPLEDGVEPLIPFKHAHLDPKTGEMESSEYDHRVYVTTPWGWIMPNIGFKAWKPEERIVWGPKDRYSAVGDSKDAYRRLRKAMYECSDPPYENIANPFGQGVAVYIKGVQINEDAAIGGVFPPQGCY